MYFKITHLFIIRCLFVLFLVSNYSMSVDLVDVYKRGKITFKADPDFGKGTDWSTFLYDNYKELIVSPDGKIYVSNRKQHKIMVFDMSGKRIKEFGQRGQGPLDFVGPSVIGFIDKRFLVVADNINQFKLSVVDLDNLDGHHTNVLKTRFRPYRAYLLQNRKIAYLGYSRDRKPDGSILTTVKISLIDIQTRKEKDFLEYKLSYDSLKQYFSSAEDNSGRTFAGAVYLDSNIDGNLLVGVSDTPDIHIYSPDGKIVKAFKLDYSPIKVTAELKETFRKRQREASLRILNQLSEEKKKRLLEANKRRKRRPPQKMFREYLPYYYDLKVDSQGNILVFPNQKPNSSKEIPFRVYSPEGKFICECKLDFGKYRLKRDEEKSFVITEHGIFAIVGERDEDDDWAYKIIKVTFDFR